jgi:hypothetical protein
MATVTPNFNWPVPTSTDLVKDGATAIEALGDSIDASLLDLKGGTSGQVLSKNSNTDMDFTWVAQDDSNAIQNTIVDAKGDLISATAADTPARVAVGTNGQVLTADSTQSTGLKWSTPAAGGKVLQVIQGTTTTLVTSQSTTFADTTLTATITPTSATSKILIMASHALKKDSGNQTPRLSMRLVRDSTALVTSIFQALYTNTDLRQNSMFSYQYLDSPATTSATTYKTQFANQAGAGADVYVQPNNETAVIILMEIGA